MIKHINPKELIKTDQFIREPVDDLSKEIIKSSSKKIILNGGRGTGKSVTLYNIKNMGLGTENQTIVTQFDSIIVFSKNPNEIFDRKFFDHYYEFEFSLNLLLYIKRNYSLIYKSNFMNIKSLLDNIAKDTVVYINNVYYGEAELKRYLTSTEISAEIIEKFKKCYGMDTLNLAIDRFDWTNGSSAYVQQVLSKYFNLFDKIIIATDDLSLNEEDRKKKLCNDGYAFKTAIYGKSVDVIKEIISRRIELYNEITENSHSFFDGSIMTDVIYRNLVNESNGNISLILDSFGEVADLLDWHEGHIENLEHQFKTAVDNQLVKIKQLREMDGNPPKFHL